MLNLHLNDLYLSMALQMLTTVKVKHSCVHHSEYLSFVNVNINTD